jgi:hypothetical protein
MGKHAEQVTTDFYTPKQSSRKRPRPLLPSKPIILLASLMLSIAVFITSLVIPLQNANQALAHGTIGTATVTSSEIVEHRRGSDSQWIKFYFKNDLGRTVFGHASRDAPQSTNELERWGRGQQVTVHYTSDDNYVVDDVMPDSFYMPILWFMLLLPSLFLSVVVSISRLRWRSQDEKMILNPKVGTAASRFNHETNRSELPAELSNRIKVESYSSLTSFKHGFLYNLFYLLAFAFAVIWMMLTLSLLTLAQPTPDGHVLALSLSLMVVSALCCLSCALCHRAYLAELEPEQDAEIARRRQLLEDHRKNLKR